MGFKDFVKSTQTLDMTRMSDQVVDYLLRFFSKDGGAYEVYRREGKGGGYTAANKIILKRIQQRKMVKMDLDAAIDLLGRYFAMCPFEYEARDVQIELMNIRGSLFRHDAK